MTTLEMEIAVMGWANVRQNVVVPNVSWGMSFAQPTASNVRWRCLHECDILKLTPTGYATEIEIKVTKADLLKDKEKPHGHSHPAIKNLYFAVPEKLVELAAKEIPARSGILCVKERNHGHIVSEVRKPKARPDAIKWTEENRNQLMRLGVMRIIGLKQKLLKHKR